MKKCKSKWNLKELRKRVYEAVADAGEVNMNKVIQLSYETETPLDTGRLRNTGVVKVIAGKKGATNISHIKIKASYGGSEGFSLMAGTEVNNKPSGESTYVDKKGRIHSVADFKRGVSTAKKTAGQLTYAIWWHEHSPKNGFNNGRKSHYLIDPFMKIINDGNGVFVSDIMWSIMQRLEGK